ncbi:hypothetical protein V8C44DRAFT_361318 [Trichoderma aethiopicum]
MPHFNMLLILILLFTSTLLASAPPEAHPPRPHVPGHWGNDTKGDEVHWLPGEPAPTNDVVFSWCRKGAVGCQRAALKHGRCYDLSMLDDGPKLRLQRRTHSHVHGTKPLGKADLRGEQEQGRVESAGERGAVLRGRAGEEVV